MPGSQILSFGPYRLNIQKEQFWHETQPVRLTPKAFQVLRYVVERPGQLVTKEELFRVLWTDTVVSDAALTTCIQEIRKALQDNSRSPQYLETVHRRGFRFIAPVEASAAPVASAEFQVPSQEEVVRSKEPEFRSQNSEVRIQEEDNHKPVLSLSTPLRINSVEGANGDNTKQAEGLRLKASGPPPSSPSSLQPVASSLSQDSALSTQDFDTPAPNTQHLAPTPPASSRLWPSKSLILAAILLMAVTALTVQYLSLPTSSTQHLTPSTQPALPLPDKPSIIVLPFVNLSEDPKQEYFSDGFTEVLTGSLSKISSLFVIARNSAFTYKGKAAKVQDVSKEMGVRYVLEGSVQKADQRVRITTQLIDATTGYHVWSEQYDRPLTDIFALQDEIVQKIVTTLKLQLTLQEQGIIVRKHTDSLEAYDFFLRGQDHYWRHTQEANAQARQLFEKAVALDPQYAEAYASLGWTYFIEWAARWSANPQTLERALALAQQAVALDDSLPGAHTSLSLVYGQKQQYDQAVTEGERAIALDPNYADSYANQAEVLNTAGRPEDALRAVAQAMRLNPRYPSWYLSELGWAYLGTGRYAEAITTLQEASSRNPNDLGAQTNLAFSYLTQLASQQNPDPQMLAQMLAAAQRVIALSDAFPWGHVLLGYVYLLQKQSEPALAEMERAITLGPNNADSYVGQARVLILAGRPEEGLRAMEQAMRLNPRYPPDYLLVLGQAYRLTGQYAEAITTLKEAISRNPNLIFAHLNLALSYLGQWVSQQSPAGQTLEPAMAAVQRALTLSGSLPSNHVVLGYIYLFQQQYESALAEMERAVALNPNDALSYAALAQVLSRVGGRAEDALAAAAQALRLKSAGAADEHRAIVGGAYYLAGRPEEAIASLKQFLSRYSNDLVAHLGSAAAYSELGREAEARAEAAEVLRLNPQFSLEVARQRSPIKDPAALERSIAALRKAGLK